MPTTLEENIDQVVEYFNNRRMDLPDGFFDRKAQFLINGATFESLLTNTPNDPLVLMLSRGPAGYRFTAKALQHALPDAKIERAGVVYEPQQASTKLWLSGMLRGTGEKMKTLVTIAMQLTAAGHVAIAEATIDAADLKKIKEARLRSA